MNMEETSTLTKKIPVGRAVLIIAIVGLICVGLLWVYNENQKEAIDESTLATINKPAGSNQNTNINTENLFVTPDFPASDVPEECLFLAEDPTDAVIQARQYIIDIGADRESDVISTYRAREIIQIELETGPACGLRLNCCNTGDDVYFDIETREPIRYDPGDV